MTNIDWYEVVAYRVPFLGIGLIIGYVAGKIDTHIRLRKEKAVDARKSLTHVAAFIVVVVTIWAAFQSQMAVTKIRENADVNIRETRCISGVLFKTVFALNERTTFSDGQARSNVALQRAQADLLGYFLNVPPDATAEDANDALKRYFVALDNFIEVQDKAANKRTQFEYPTKQELNACLRQARQ